MRGARLERSARGTSAGGRWRLEEVRIRRPARVSVGEQLEAHLARAIGEGRLGPGRILPSTRRLAARLPVHRNTAAAVYRRLARRGLVEVSPGRRARVVEAEPRPAGDGSAYGPPTGGVSSSRRVAVVADGARHRRALIRDVASHLDDVTEILPLPPDEARDRPGALAGLVPLAEIGHLRVVRRIHPPGSPVVSLWYAPLEPVLDSIRAGRYGRTAVVLTASPVVRRDVRALAAGRERGSRIVVPGSLGRRSLRAVVGAADVVWVDRSRRQEVEGGPRPEVRPLPLVSSRSVRELHQLMAERARSGGAAHSYGGADDPHGRGPRCAGARSVPSSRREVR